MIGKSLGHYEIVEPLGAGGMGEVYRARDASLKRDVAVKVLPADLADDPERLARLEREAHLLAALNHSNIATIHSLEESEGTRFLVMELVPGRSLEDLLAEGPLPVDEALDICRQIAEALEAAHEENIIHRDLKPANVIVTPAGKAKVLDFGLAKTVETATSSTDLSHSPTMTIAATQAGVILGTAPYMSPEQVRGKRLDKRADIWAFGCVLYEALVGRRAFDRETVADTLAAILEVEPPWDGLPASTPGAVRSMMHRCFRKDPKRRLRDIGDARIEMEEALGVAPVAAHELAAVGALAADRGVPLKLALPLSVAAAFAVVAVWYALQPAPGPTEYWEYSLPNGVEFELSSEFAISPDGSRLVFTYNPRDLLWVREAGSSEWRPIAHTEGADSLAVSPDGEQVAFASDDKIQRVGFTGGAPSVVAEVVAEGLSWGEDDMIYFSQRMGEGIWRVSADGGEPEQIVTLRESEWAFGPQLLPGGEWILFSVNHTFGYYWPNAEVVAESLVTKERRTLTQGTHGRYVSTGHILSVHDSALFAAPFDANRVRVTGAQVQVEDGVQHRVVSGRADYAVSGDGRLVFRPGGYYTDERPLVWFDRDGDFAPLPFEPNLFWMPRPSPDESHIAVAAYSTDLSKPTDRYILVYEVDSEVSWQLTREGRAGSPTWSPDGRYVYFAWNKNGSFDIWKALVDRSADPELVWSSEGSDGVSSISRDGSVLLGWSRGGAGGGMRCWRLSLEGPSVAVEQLAPAETAEQLAPLKMECGTPDISPDGRYFVYQSNEEGTVKISVQELSLGGKRWTVSEGRVTRPRWSPDGTEIFYRTMEGENPTSMYAVEVTTEPVFSAAPPHKLFDWYNEGDNSFGVSADGERFLMIGPIEKPASHLTIITNWFEELKAKAPTGR